MKMTSKNGRWICCITLAVACTAALFGVPQQADARRQSLSKELSRVTGKTADRSSKRWALSRNIFSVSAQWSKLSKKQRAEARDILARPTSNVSRRAREVGYTTKEAEPFGTAHFRVHYVRETRHAPIRVDKNGNGVRDFVELVAEEAERAWQKEVVERGWPPPPQDGNMGGDGRQDIYLADLTSDGAFGATVPNRMPSSRASFLIIDNDLPPDDTRGVATLDSLRQTVTHEFFHTIQLGINQYLIERDDLIWLAESSATWMETTLSENDKEAVDALEGLYSMLSLPIIGEDAAIEGTIYGGWPYWQRIVDSHGEDAIKSIFTKLGKMGRSIGSGSDRYGTATIDRILKRRGDSLENLFTGFALDAYMSASNHYGAEADPETTSRVVKLNRAKRFTERSERFSNGRFTTDKRERLEGLATHYYILKTNSPGKLSVRVSWRGPQPKIYLVVGGRSGVVYTAPPGKGSITATVRVEPGVLQRVGVIISSRSTKSARIFGRARLTR